MVVKQIAGEVGEQLFELGQNVGQQAKKQIVQGTVQAAKTQITGQKTGDGKAAGSQEKDSSKNDKPVDDKTGKQHFAQMLGDTTKMSSTQLAQAKQEDVMKAVSEASQVRAELQAEKIKKEQIIRRYQQIQKDIEEYRAKKGEEIPKYISGKPGQAAKPEEQAEKMEELKKEEEEAKKEEKKKSILSAVTDRLQGTKERGKIVG